jgi:hypothetical protein
VERRSDEYGGTAGGSVEDESGDRRDGSVGVEDGHRRDDQSDGNGDFHAGQMLPEAR